MMCVRSPKVVDVQRHPGVVDEALKELVEQINIETADHAACEAHVEHQPRAAGQIEHHPRQGLVQRHIGMPVTSDTLLVSDRLGEGLTQRDADILHRVVRVDVQITPGEDIQIDQTMPGDLVEHVLEKRYPGLHACHPAAVEIDRDSDLRLQGIAFDAGAASHRSLHVLMGELVSDSTRIQMSWCNSGHAARVRSPARRSLDRRSPG